MNKSPLFSTPVRIIEAIAIFCVLFLAVLIKVFYFPVYEAESIIVVDIKKSPTSVETERTAITESLGYIRAHMELLKSEPVLRNIVDELRLYEDAWIWKEAIKKGERNLDAIKEKASRQMVELLRKRYIVLNSPVFTDLIEIKVKNRVALKAADIANTLMRDYISWSISFTHQEVDRVIEYLDKEVQLAKERLTKSEEALEKFREKNEVISLPDEIKAYLQAIPEEIKSHFKVVQAMEIKLLELEVELSRLRELYTDNSPQVIYMKKRIAELTEDLQKRQIETRSTEEYIAPLRDVPQKEFELARLTRDVKINETLYTFLVQEQEKARLLRVKETTQDIKIVSPALVPIKPKGRMITFVIGTMISLIFAISLPAFFEYRKILF